MFESVEHESGCTNRHEPGQAHPLALPVVCRRCECRDGRCDRDGHLWSLNFVDVFCGLLWTGIDLFICFMLVPN